jgi:preprotein translocase subunit SecF
LFFGAGLFAACLYVIPLGETYFQEFKKWKFFRVGSNAVGKGLLVLFLFIFAGSYVALSTDKQYGESFSDSLGESISNLALKEVENAQMQQNSPESNEVMIQDSMNQIRVDYPNLTEAQYSQMETQLWEKINSTGQAEDASKEQVNRMVDASLKTSPLLNSMLIWFPLFLSFTIWAALEGLRTLVFSPISGIFTHLLFNIPFFGERTLDAKYAGSVQQ